MKNNDPFSPLDLKTLSILLNPKKQSEFLAAVAAGPAPVADTGADDEEGLETPPWPCRPELDVLRSQQRMALEDLMGGKSYTETAQNAGVSRKTVYNWERKDPAFIAAMAGFRRRAIQSAEDRLTHAVSAAAGTLSAAAARDYRAAAILLKGRGLLPGPAKPGKDNPIAQLLSLPPSKRRAFELRLRELILSFREEPAIPAMTSTPPATAAPVTLPAAGDPAVAAPGDSPSAPAQFPNKLDPEPTPAHHAPARND
jgi:hypothetical protein